MWFVGSTGVAPFKKSRQRSRRARRPSEGIRQGVELAIEQLTAAAKSGDDADIAEATDTLERVLRARRLL